MEIRPAVEQDLDQINDLYNHYVREAPATFDIEPLSLDARREWFSQYADQGRYRLLVAARGNDVVGYAASGRFRPKRAYETSVETSVYLRAGETGRGIGMRLYSELFKLLEGEDLHRAYAGITMPNPASVRLHERFGFKQVAYFSEQGRKFGRYWDVAWFERDL